MRNLTFLLALIPFLFSCNQGSDINIEVVSLNIRYDNPRDGINAWPERKEIITDFLSDEAPDIFGLQEALHHQYQYIDSILNDYSSLAAGRDDGKTKGEMIPVFFKSNKFKIIKSGTFWLSETPEVPGSRGWGAVLPRIVTWVELMERKSGREFYFFNTHFSHMSDSARFMSAGILLKSVITISEDKPFIITGDFNMLSSSEAYQTLTENGNEDAIVKDSYLLSASEPEGPNFTFNGFKDVVGRGRIDYIFIQKSISVIEHSTLNIKEGEVFISDHWPVKTEVIIR